MARRKILLITGIAGFVGKYLTEEVMSVYLDWEIHGLQRSSDRRQSDLWGRDFPIHELDIRDTISVNAIIQKTKPDYVFHLAAQPFVPKAIQDPWGTMDINVKGTLNLLESLRKLPHKVRMVYVSSADVYGRQSPDQMPLEETTTPFPINPYSSSKLAAEVYCRQFSIYADNLDVMIARPFNHIGVGQREEFVVPNFCAQIAKEPRSEKGEIHVGDLSATRDFLDVRDVVSAYGKILEAGVSGEIYNISSGEEVSIREILEKIIKISGKDILIHTDPERIRPVETPRLFGKNEKLKNLGWGKKWSIDDSLREIYDWIKNLSSSSRVG